MTPYEQRNPLTWAKGDREEVYIRQEEGNLAQVIFEVLLCCPRVNLFHPFIELLSSP
jgi:hypothetical protein